MGDGLKLSKDKRHRSSSSIAGAGLEGTRSERKLDIRALIPEVDDHFALAEARCNDLQEKIELVKVLKRKKKLNKRSMTRVSEQQIAAENVPFISVRTQPKKKVAQQATRLRRLEVPTNPTRGFLDPATAEQHRMLGQVWGYGQNYNREGNEYRSEQKMHPRTRVRRNRADGDGMCGRGVESSNAPTEVACGQDDDIGFSDTQIYDQGTEDFARTYEHRKQMDNRSPSKAFVGRKEKISKDNGINDVPNWIDSSLENVQVPRGRVNSPVHRYQPNKQQQNIVQRQSKVEERPVVELFNSSRSPLRATNQSRPMSKKEENRSKKHSDVEIIEEQNDVQLDHLFPTESNKECQLSTPQRAKYRSRGYEMPTVASQMKQADIRQECSLVQHSNMPFIGSKSTAPSHNIGVNIQQVLNGLKIQQPLYGIPLTIAQHLGLGHVKRVKCYTTEQSPASREINAIKLGERQLLLPSSRSMSFKRLLGLYREGDGKVARFLRKMRRPKQFATSMHNLPAIRNDAEGISPRKRSPRSAKTSLLDCGSTKRKLSEYTNLYHEYEALGQRIAVDGTTPEIEQRREELLRELVEREEIIRKLVQDSNLITQNPFSLSSLRASASAANEGRQQRDSGDQPQL